MKRDLAHHAWAAEREPLRIARARGLLLELSSSPGSFVWTARGLTLRRVLRDHLRTVLLEDGFDEVGTNAATDIANPSRWISPNLAAHAEIFRSRLRSPSDPPLRVFEFCSRDRGPASLEKPSTLRDTLRLELDDGHVFASPDRVAEELSLEIRRVLKFYQALGLELRARLDPSDDNGVKPQKLSPGGNGGRHLERYRGELVGALERHHVELEPTSEATAGVGIGAVFVAPNLHGIFNHPCATLRVETGLAEHLGLTYHPGASGPDAPVILHRTTFGCLEDVVALLLEKTAGSFPLWLAPVQVRVVTVSKAALAYGRSLQESLKRNGIRTEFDARSEAYSFKIREAARETLPYVVLVGGNEAERETVSFLRRGETRDPAESSLDEFISRLQEEAADRGVKVGSSSEPG